MRNSLLIAATIILILIILIFLKGNQKSLEKLVTPATPVTVEVKITPSPTQSPIPTSYNKSTDLKKELDSVNPEVKDSDFENLKNLLPLL